MANGAKKVAAKVDNELTKIENENAQMRAQDAANKV
jgi:hypothetical protein